MRPGFNGLAAKVETVLKEDPYSGDVIGGVRGVEVTPSLPDCYRQTQDSLTADRCKWRKRGFPLRRVLCALPAPAVGLDVGGGALIEGSVPRRAERQRCLGSFPRCDRVRACCHKSAALLGLLARNAQADGVKRAQAHFARPPRQCETERPALRARARNL